MEHQDWKPVVFKKIVKKEAVVKTSRASDETHRNRIVQMMRLKIFITKKLD